MNRRLAASLVADVVGYSRLMGDELVTLKERRATILEPVVRAHGGRIVKVMGDGVLIELASAVNAVKAAFELQREMAEANEAVPEDRRVILRIGINLGDVIGEGADIYGDGVNIAARLEALAEPGGVCISAKVHEEVKGKIEAPLEDMGEVELKNIARPVRVYRVGTGSEHIIATPAKAPAAKSSIAVLPFINMSDDPGQQYFSDGVTEDIITELSRFRPLHVLARNSSFRYRGKDIDIVRAGRELGVQYVVEGSVRRVGGRITAQLIDTATGNHVWADHYDRTQDEIFDVQDQVVRTIVGTLVGRVLAAGSELAKRKPPANLTTYECVLRAEALPWKDPAGSAEARKLCERAIELDPDCVRAFTILSALDRRIWLSDINAPDSLMERALDLAKQGVAIDPNDSHCHHGLAEIYLYRGAHELSEWHHLKAVELNPNRPGLLMGLAHLYHYTGRSSEAIAQLAAAKAIDPFFNPIWYWSSLLMMNYAARQYDEGVGARLLESRNLTIGRKPTRRPVMR